MSKLTRILPLCLLCLCLPAIAHADTVVLTSGSVSAGNPVLSAHPGYAFNFAGAGLTANGLDEKLGNGRHDLGCLFCTPGQSATADFDINSFTGNSISANSATVGGVTYSPIWFNGSEFHFFTAPVVIPDSTAQTLQLTTSFTFNGVLTGLVPPFTDTSVPVFTTMLSGQGIATLTFHRVDQGGVITYAMDNVTYTFQPAAVPEPATLLLLGTGLAGLSAAARRRLAR